MLSAENIELRKCLDQALSSETFSFQNQQLREVLLHNEKQTQELLDINRNLKHTIRN
jgi:hypothetical protein